MNDAGKAEVEKELENVEGDLFLLLIASKPEDENKIKTLELRKSELLQKLEDYATSM